MGFYVRKNVNSIRFYVRKNVTDQRKTNNWKRGNGGNGDRQKNFMGHSSQKSGGDCGRFLIEYPKLMCITAILEYLVAIVKAPWVRLEDVSFYLDLGIDFFKTAGRTQRLDELIAVAEAYMARQYEGNLWDILGRSLDFFDKRYPSLASNGAFSPEIFICNEALDDFLDFCKKKVSAKNH
ncbi:MAG: hypothetical protein GTN53_05950 [Candidatus Aminicenantes bacterium]|nr:hypothetical protein [Candidatus Aminicenantes bacterium]NIQ66038.1 hypothetical protein [Candidatus Aminicenantes bacterium]NIT22031.1 hypothetical protein [Candidatus Aminicenantes bacterium]